MASPSHRSQSVDLNNLQALQGVSRDTRRMSLSLPQTNSPVQAGRPPSPLRNGFIPDTSTGIHPDDDDDDDHDSSWRMRSPSPASSVSQLAANFAQRVGSLVSNIGPRGPGYMPTDAELEAEAEMERDRSRREAERILTREAMERKMVEERVLEMMESTKGLPPPPSRSQTLPANPPSPSASQKDSFGWWAAAKSRLTPTKDKDLTPAQQVIQETKSREKEKEKEKKNGKGKEKEWPANTDTKYNDPAFLNLATPPRRPVPSSPASPTPRSTLPPNLTPSPRRSADTISSPSAREAPPLYAQFDAHGTLDVHVTLLTLAKRFEKLEKWTVGHVRALEERMGDVERWLVEKETQKENEATPAHEEAHGDLSELRDEVSELQSRMGELGREMARMAVSPANLSSGPSRQSAEISSAPPTTSEIVEHGTGDDNPFAASPPNKDRFLPPTARQSTSPPMASSSKFSAVSRLPYPSGDYATPPDSSTIPQGPVRSSSPTESLSRSQPMSFPGLPMANPSAGYGLGLGISSAPSLYSTGSYSSASSVSPSGLPRTTSPTAGRGASRSPSVTQGRPLPAPVFPAGGPAGSFRVSSVSPTPTPKARKRYTVALGGPIVPPPDDDEDTTKNINNNNDDDDDFGGEETIGKKSSTTLKSALHTPKTTPQSFNEPYTPQSSPPDRRGRAQSTYGTPSKIMGSMPTTPTTILPLNPNRLRSKSTDRLFASAAAKENGNGTLGNKFIDPLVLRRQQEVSKAVGGGGGSTSGPSAKGKGKLPVEELVKFFDGDRKKGR